MKIIFWEMCTNTANSSHQMNAWVVSYLVELKMRKSLQRMKFGSFNEYFMVVLQPKQFHKTFNDNKQ